MDHILTGSFPVVSKSMTTKRGSKAITMVLKFTNLNQMTFKGCPDGGWDFGCENQTKVQESIIDWWQKCTIQPSKGNNIVGHLMVDGFESNKPPQGLPLFLGFPHKTLRVPEMTKKVG